MDGILLLNKPKGLTSHDCVFKVRKLLKMKKVGHTGTLDPEVSGVLPICLGRATKIAQFITASDKTYEGEVTIGFSTSTEDATGEKVQEKKIDKTFTRTEILTALQSLTGEIQQTPPMFSAVKVNGKRLYEYARQGIEVERPTRTVNIIELVLLDDRLEFSGETISFRFRVKCSKGTYVRTLAVQIGEKLGFPAHMSDLIRTNSGKFNLDQCFSLEEVEEMVKNQIIEENLLSIEEALSHLREIIISDKVAEKVKNGAVLPLPDQLNDIESEEPFTVRDERNRTLAIYQKHPEKVDLIKPIKILVNNHELT